MAWYTGLDDEQRQAASHIGSHACLLAGPGTGKTLVIARRIVFLIHEMGIDPSNILALTFTRAAAAELRQRVVLDLEDIPPPQIYTLHSFALRQLLRNSHLPLDIPRPLRIADDWEERNAVIEDLKRILDTRVAEIEEKFRLLSADWHTLEADTDRWDQRFPDPRFLAAWQDHRRVYGYTLRAELVYRLKRALDQYEDFRLQGPPRHVLVDEYQDLNPCDLAVIRTIVAKGAELFAAGDDDQSIYLFRLAYLPGIRRFEDFYPDATVLTLTVSRRCDPAILEIGRFVAEQDYETRAKTLRPEISRPPGEVQILRFADQEEEAAGIARLCRHLTVTEEYYPEEILVLLRSDQYAKFSGVLRSAFERMGLRVICHTTEPTPLDEEPGRQLIAVLRLLLNREDHLAWRTLLQLRRNRIGQGGILAIYTLAREQGIRFVNALKLVSDDPTLIPRYGQGIAEEMTMIGELLAATGTDLLAQEGWHQTIPEQQAREELLTGISRLAQQVIPSGKTRQAVLAHIRQALLASNATTLSALLRALEVAPEHIQQELEEGKVNIMTMHRAKGLTAEAVVMVGAEDEQIPGPNLAAARLAEERRLLYVSLTRAKHHLFVTYCEKRTGSQRYSGRAGGYLYRNLTRFLADGPISPVSGREYIRQHCGGWG